MATNIKLKPQEENLTETNIKKVVGLLEPKEGKPITKTLACQLLCISYNVTRLDRIVTKFKEQTEYRERRQKENRGKPATKDDIDYIIREYMSGSPISDISKSLFRGPTFVNNILDFHEVPKRPATQDYFKPELIPDSAVRETFNIGEKVYSARYDSLATVEALFSNKEEKVYRIYLIDEKWKQYAYQPASELASLENISKLGIRL